MGQFGMGQPVRRLEDVRFLTGAGAYTDDIRLPHQAAGWVLRSPHAHARIKAIDKGAALALPGVLAVYTHEDVAHLGRLPSPAPLTSRNGQAAVKMLKPILTDVVRHVGDMVAFIVAESVETARDVGEALIIEYEPLPCLVDPVAALAPGAPVVHAQAPGNLCMDWEHGDETTVDAAFAKAAHIIEIDLVNNRLVGNALEPRTAMGVYQQGRFTLYSSTQGGHDLKKFLSQDIFRRPAADFQIITPDVGGGFGTKIFLYAEHALALFAAEQLGRPVKWIGDRSDSFLSDAQGRDNLTNARLALDEQGRFLALKVDTIANLGAYASQYGPFIPTGACRGMLIGGYDFPAIHVRVRGVYTHTVPVDAYRGAGRPESAFTIERLIDHAARRLGMTPADLRRRNFIQPEQMPYRTALGLVYDSGNFPQNMEQALVIADWDGFGARREESRQKGRLRGIGLATYIEACAGGNPEDAVVEFLAEGGVRLLVGTQSNGQGHATAYAQLVADRLGIDIGEITLIQGDTDIVKTGHGTGGSRSAAVGGAALIGAADALLEKGRRLAAHYLETAAADLDFSEGRFTIAGTDRQIELSEIARRAHTGELPAGETPGLDGAGSFQPPESTFPNGCHIVEIEVDPETGATAIERYTVVDDFGRIVNPLLLAGQVHGGIAQGVGQALLEGVVYDEGGQLLTASFMDYCMPRADNLPNIAFSWNEVPCTTNPLGIKGCGEAGAIGAPPAVINALVSALEPLGVSHVPMPATPFALWQLIQTHRRAS